MHSLIKKNTQPSIANSHIFEKQNTQISIQGSQLFDTGYPESIPDAKFFRQPESRHVYVGSHAVGDLDRSKPPKASLGFDPRQSLISTADVTCQEISIFPGDLAQSTITEVTTN